MNHELIAAVLAALFSSSGAVGLLGLWLNHREKAKQEKADEADRRRDKQAEDSKNWYRESREHYKTAKDEAAEARKECATCKKELQKTRGVVFMLLEELEDQLIPMLMIPDTDPVEIRKAARAVIHRARDSL